eukprot:7336165-Alexandrium_andersonii.AAC.1
MHFIRVAPLRALALLQGRPPAHALHSGGVPKFAGTSAGSPASAWHFSRGAPLGAHGTSSGAPASAELSRAVGPHSRGSSLSLLPPRPPGPEHRRRRRGDINPGASYHVGRGRLPCQLRLAGTKRTSGFPIPGSERPSAARSGDKGSAHPKVRAFGPSRVLLFIPAWAGTKGTAGVRQ